MLVALSRGGPDVPPNAGAIGGTEDLGVSRAGVVEGVAAADVFSGVFMLGNFMGLLSSAAAVLSLLTSRMPDSIPFGIAQSTFEVTVAMPYGNNAHHDQQDNGERPKSLCLFTGVSRA